MNIFQTMSEQYSPPGILQSQHADQQEDSIYIKLLLIITTHPQIYAAILYNLATEIKINFGFNI